MPLEVALSILDLEPGVDVSALGEVPCMIALGEVPCMIAACCVFFVSTVLKIAISAPPADVSMVKARFRELSKSVHPDKNPHVRASDAFCALCKAVSTVVRAAGPRYVRARRFHEAWDCYWRGVVLPESRHATLAVMHLAPATAYLCLMKSFSA